MVSSTLTSLTWALRKEDDVTLIREVQYFRAHHSKAAQIAHRIGALKESLQTERLAMYCSSERLAAANAIAHIHRRINWTCTKPLTSKAKEDTRLKLLSAIAPYMLGARTTTKCVIGVVRQATT